MKIAISKEKKDWDKFLIENNGSFLQSWDYGTLQEKEGKKIWRFEVLDNKRKVLQAQVQKEKFPFGKNLFYIGYGPCFNSKSFLKEKKKSLFVLLNELKKLAQKENVIFLNIEPKEEIPKVEEILKSKRRVQPQKTLILSLNEDKDIIFKKFHSKTRYNIRLAKRKGVVAERIFKEEEKMKYFDKFWELLRKTAGRGNFKTLSRKYYKNLLFLDNAFLYIARFKDKIVASSIILFFGDTVYYLHGASDYKYRNLMAPHFLHFYQIFDAKDLNFKFYDFWGIDEKKWPGVTRFKKGFGGKEVVYPEGIDFVFNKSWYFIYIFLKKIKEIF